MNMIKGYIEERAKQKLEYEDQVKAHRVQSSDDIAYLGNASDAGSVITEYKGSEADKIGTSDNLVTCATHDIDAEFRPAYETGSSNEVTLINQNNIFSDEHQQLFKVNLFMTQIC